MNLKNIHPEVFRYFKTQTRSEEAKLIHEMCYWRKAIPQNVQDKVLNILKISKELKKALEPMTEIGIPLNIDLVGGALRDLVLKKHDEIKDLDFLLSFHFKNVQKIKKIENCAKIFRLDLNDDKYNKILYRKENQPMMSHWQEKKSTDYLKNVKIFDLLALLLAKNFQVETFYLPRYEIQNYEKYIDHAIIGVIKIKQKDWMWPVDIIISDYSAETFINKFDFDICRIYCNIQNIHEIIHQEEKNIDIPEKFFQYIKMRKSFLQSVQKKELTFPISDQMTLYNVQRSLEIHLPQIEKKYPWKLKTFETGDESINQYIKSFFQKRQLNKQLVIKKEDINIVKI